MIDRLEMLIALAREGHFGRAAESLNISQPSLSAGIRSLEAHLGVQLVHRGSRYGGLTPEGQSALMWARRIVGDARQLREEMRTKRHGLAGEVRIAVIPTALTWAARLAAAMTARHPRLRFAVQSRNSREILAMLEGFEADAGISYLDNEPLGRVVSAPLYVESYVLVCPKGGPFAGRAAVGWSELDGARLALLTPDMQNRRIINQIFADHGLTPRPEIESNTLITLIASAAEGQCMTIVPMAIARFLAGGKDLALIPLEGGGKAHRVGLILPERDPRTPVLDALLAEARKIAEVFDRIS
jgi:DNA-binding transcriptional LysR family regulator